MRHADVMTKAVTHVKARGTATRGTKTAPRPLTPCRVLSGPVTHGRKDSHVNVSPNKCYAVLLLVSLRIPKKIEVSLADMYYEVIYSTTNVPNIRQLVKSF